MTGLIDIFDYQKWRRVMDYITVQQAAEKWNLSVPRVQQLFVAGRIYGAVQPARDWLIPKDIEKPEYGRKNNRRQPKKVASRN